MKNLFNLQMFAAPTNTTVTADLEPAISIDFSNRLATNITELQNILGITEMIPMASGQTIKIYKTTQKNTPEQVGEGEEINLTEIERKVAKTIEITLCKYRKLTTAEAIQRSGRQVAVNMTDAKLLEGVQKGIKKDFYTLLATGTGATAGTGLQKTISNVWAELQKFYDDLSATPIYFVSSEDAAEYLGNAKIDMQQAFGMSYVEDFFGLGTLVISPSVAKGKVIGTAKENLNGAYVPAMGGDLATSFGLTGDATGLVGITHSVGTNNATIETLMMSGVKFFPEMLDGVIVGTINSEAA